MTRAPWEADHDLTPQRFARIIERRFVEFHEPEVKALPHGWDYLTYQVDGDWVFKVPKRADVVSRMRQEVSLLTALPSMPAAVPRPSFHGVAADDLPYPFFGYPHLGGVFASEVETIDRVAVIGEALAFLDALHGIVPPFAVEGWPDGTWDQRIDQLHHVRERAPQFIPSLEWLRRNEPITTTKTLLHDDLGPEHLLLHAESHALVGVLDWADAARGDPARDLVSLLLWDPVACAAAYTARDGSPQELARGYAHALLKGLRLLQQHIRWAPEHVDVWTRRMEAVQRAVLG